MGGFDTNSLMEGFVGMTDSPATGRTATWCPSDVTCASKVMGDPCPVRDRMPTCRVLGLRMPPVRKVHGGVRDILHVADEWWFMSVDDGTATQI
jgi:hypothetical protein